VKSKQQRRRIISAIGSMAQRSERQTQRNRCYAHGTASIWRNEARKKAKHDVT